jgi:hypothetical protein
MKDTFEEIFLIPEAIYREILAGEAKARTDIPVIIKAIDEGWVKVKKIGKANEKILPDSMGEGVDIPDVERRKKAGLVADRRQVGPQHRENNGIERKIQRVSSYLLGEEGGAH